MIHATSHTHPIRVDVVPTGPLPGRLGLTLAPGKKDASGMARIRWDRDLETDLRDLRNRFGTDVLVSLMRPHEYVLLEIANLSERAEAHGMMVRDFPIDDVSVPDDARAEEFHAFVTDLYGALQDGHVVTVYSRGGLGRSGLVAACILVRHGLASEAALRRVRSHRPGAIETHAQEAYVGAYASRLLNQPHATRRRDTAGGTGRG